MALVQGISWTPAFIVCLFFKCDLGQQEKKICNTKNNRDPKQNEIFVLWFHGIAQVLPAGGKIGCAVSFQPRVSTLAFGNKPVSKMFATAEKSPS